MRIKGFSAVILSAFLTITLCGCDKGDGNSNSADNSTGSEISDISPVIYPDPADATFLQGAAGDHIGLSEIVYIRDIENNELSPDELTEDNFYRVTINSAYYSLPLYPCLTSLDSEYDEDALLFRDAPQTEQSVYFKAKKGDKIFGLTVAEASSEFSIDWDHFNLVSATDLTLEGEITLSGYACVVPDNEYGISVGDIIFLPVGNVQLPVVRFVSVDENEKIYRRTGDIYVRNGITYTNEFAEFFLLGNINDTAADVSILPSDGSLVKVNVTISNIKMTTTLNWLTQINAEIISITSAN